MDRLSAMAVFVRVAEAGSFSKAALRLGLSNSTVTSRVKALEEHLGARLFERTTRRVRLTETGRAYLERCAHLLSELEETELSVRSLHAKPRGKLCVNAPISFGGLHVAPAIPDFLARFPDMHVELSLTDRFVDVVEEGYDLAIRGRSVPADSSLIARKFVAETFAACATPKYLAAHGRPRTPLDLAGHNCLTYTGRAVWRFEAGDARHEVTVSGNLSTNNGDALRAATLSGLGIALLPNFIIARDFEAGVLERVLGDFIAPEAAFYAIYPHNRYLSGKARAFIDFLIERFSVTPVI